MKINIIGEYFGDSGYNIHTKQLASALNTLGEEVSLTCNKPIGWEQNVNDAELLMLQRESTDAEVNLCINTPPTWRYYLAEGKRFVGFLVWEGTNIPSYWLEVLADDLCEQIWVPSEHTKMAILNTININLHNKDYQKIVNKIKVVPHGVDKSLFYCNHQNSKTENLKPLTFIADKGWTSKSWEDRGGLSYLIKAFSEEFTSKDNVKLVCKVNACYGINSEILNKNILDLQIENEDKPKINFIINNVNYKQLNDIYNQGDVFVSTSLAEGFNIPCLQAQSAGLPVLTTSFGGQSDFVNNENGWLLPAGELISVKDDIMYEEVMWEKPNITEIRLMLRYIYNNQNEIEPKSLKSLESSSKMTWIDSAKKAQSFLKK